MACMRKGSRGEWFVAKERVCEADRLGENAKTRKGEGRERAKDAKGTYHGDTETRRGDGTGMYRSGRMATVSALH